MFRIESFKKAHIDRAREIALENYENEKSAVVGLPNIDTLPDLRPFADNGLGKAIFDNGNMLGFLCCEVPWDKAFGSASKGTFTPIHAHGAVLENRSIIYKRLYQAAAEKWVSDGITYHAIALYAHDSQAINAFFTYGFGLRCIDAVRPLVNFESALCSAVIFHELEKDAAEQVRAMRVLQTAHMGESPCFMRSLPTDVEKWLKRAETRDSRLFTANLYEKPVAYIEVMDDGENFAAEHCDMKNIKGAFCLPEYRGKGIVQGLLNYVISALKSEGYSSLGVDFESFNPTASGFWLKHFTAYTNSVVRRIDECALLDVGEQYMQTAAKAPCVIPA
ncbi:MAG: GNAT family N-acetyltransferase [Oscillospiraceae bacterium]|jgi:GNAT superfamily N-acetyltransferase|nr:GNAT family N-acetyltransferase [Oscillospiraceae bacterium]